MRVWAQCQGRPDYDTVSQLLIDRTLAILENIYDPMREVMGPPILDEDGGDDAIDFYLLDQHTSVFRRNTNLSETLGATVPDNPVVNNGKSAFVLLGRHQAFLIPFHTHVVHEFFHVLQNRHNHKFKLRPVSGNTNVREKHWFPEASAVWAEVYFDRELERFWEKDRANFGTHQKWFWLGFQTNSEGLNTTKPKFQHYSAYIWPYFVEQEKKDKKATFMSKIWAGLDVVTTFEQADDVIDSVYPFADHFKTFALRNLNMALLPGDPLPESERYVSLDKDQFPDGFGPKFEAPAELQADQPFQRSLTLQPLSARYLRFGHIRKPMKVEFDFTGLQPQGLTDIHMLVRSTDSKGISQWVKPPFDDSSANKVVFCLSEGPTTPDSRGDFDEIIMVVSNHGKRDKVSGNLVARPVSKPCATVWNAKIKGDITGGPQRRRLVYH